MEIACTSISMVGKAPPNSYCHHFLPQGVSHLPLVSLGGSPRSANGSCPSSFQTIASAWDLEHVEFCVLPLRAESQFPNTPSLPLMLPNISFPVFKARLVTWCTPPWTGKPDVGLEPFSLGMINYDISPICGLLSK